MFSKYLKKVSSALGIILMCNISTPTMARGFFGEYAEGEILSLGSSLNSKQESYLREYFGVSEDIEAIYVDTEMAVKQLGLDKSMLETYTGGWYSSAYVKLTKKSGIKVTADNLTLVTDDMLANALITSGILNAEVIASAPFKVSGESALAGILAGAEEIMGEKLSQENKETAQKEIETTLDVADEIGQKEASTIMNEIKAEVIKDSPTTITQIENIIINVTNNYGIELSEKTRNKVASTMSDINDLDIDYKEVKDTLKEVGNKLISDLKDALNKGEEISMKIKESGILEKIWNAVKKAWNAFWQWINNLNNSDDVNNAEEVINEEFVGDEEEVKEDVIDDNVTEDAYKDDVIEDDSIESENVSEGIEENVVETEITENDNNITEEESINEDNEETLNMN